MHFTKEAENLHNENYKTLMEETEEKREWDPMFMEWKNSCCVKAHRLKEINTFSAIPVKILMTISTNRENNLKIQMGPQKTLLTKIRQKE